MRNGHDKIDAGEVTILLNGESLTLRPTMRAARAVSRRSGGFAKVRQEIIDENFDTVVYIIAVGTNILSDNNKTTKLENDVWANGLDLKLLTPLMEYVAVLNNGGRPLPANMKGVFSMSDDDYSEVTQIEHQGHKEYGEGNE